MPLAKPDTIVKPLLTSSLDSLLALSAPSLSAFLVPTIEIHLVFNISK